MILGYKELLNQVKKNEITPVEAMDLIKKSNNEKTRNYYFENCLISKLISERNEKKSFGNIIVVCEEKKIADKLQKEIDERKYKYKSFLWLENGSDHSNEFNNIDTVIYVQSDFNEQDIKYKIEKGIYTFVEFMKSIVPFCKHTYVEYVCIENEKEEPVFSSMIGLLRSISKELNLRGFKNITLKENDPDAIVPIILDEYEEEGTDVIYDGTERKSYELKRRFFQNTINTLKSGTYIITGGCGGLGRIIANYLADSGTYNIILTGRSYFDSSIEKICTKLSRNNCKVVYKKSDVCIKEDVKELFDFVNKEYGKVTGVIHSAGVLSDKLFFNKTENDFNKVLSVKVNGTINLYNNLDNDALFILFSSITSVTGNIGQTDYGYANEFMNKFAYKNNKNDGKRLISICWPLWENGGMQIDEKLEKNIEQAVGSKLISTENGIEAFCKAISSDLSNIVVVNGRYDKIMAHFSEIKSVEPVFDTEDNIEIQEKLKKEIGEFLLNIMADVLESSVDDISVYDNFESFGLNSIMNMDIIYKIEEKICPVSKTIMYECHTIDELTDYMLKEYYSQCCLAFDHIIRSNKKYESQKNIVKTVIEEKIDDDNDDAIAIVGIAGTYPHSKNLEEFWNNIILGNDCIDEVPSSRWDFEDYYSKEKNAEGKSISKWGGFIEDYDKFDPLFFNISPRDAAGIDPQERLMLQTAWHTFENAGYTKNDLNGSNTGVYIGVMYAHYQYYGIGGKHHQYGVAMTNSSISNRISYFMNFHGPCMSVDTMCSSSLTALDIACNDIKLNKVESALVGGVNLSLHPNKYVILSQKHFLSSDGKCHSFEEGGDGYVPSEGVGAIYIKKLSKAKADGDRILAVVRSTALNHGGHTSGFTVPNPELQSEVIKDALEIGNVYPKDVTYIEAHGTGTAIGDPIEIKGLSKAFSDLKEKNKIAIGSLKSVFGHPESAAGIAAITKIILQMKNNTIPPSIVRRKINENLELEKTPFYLVNEPINWETDGHKIAGISSFGAGGSNAHVILEEYIDTNSVDLSNEDEKQIFVLSAKDEKQLKQKAFELARFFETKLYGEEIKENIYSEESVSVQLKNKVSELLKVGTDDIDADVSLSDLGMDIYLIRNLNNYISNEFDIDYSDEDFFELDHISKLSQNICCSFQKTVLTDGDSEFYKKAAISLALEREHMIERLAFTADDLRTAIRLLDAYYNNEITEDIDIYTGNVLKSRKTVNEMEKNIDIDSLIENKAYDEICRLWAIGYSIDFYKIHTHKVHTPLPLYPFKKDRYFVEDMANRLDNDNMIITSENSDVKRIFSKHFSRSDYYVDQHIVGKRNYLQGVAFLDLFYNYAKIINRKNICISNIIWKYPLDLTDNSMDVKIDINNNEIEAYSENCSNKTLYCAAFISEKTEKLLSLNDKEIKNEALNILPVSDFYDIFNNRDIKYGNELRGIKNISYSDNAVFASISYDDQYSNDDNTIRILDAAAQCGIMLIYSKDNGVDRYVPFSVGNMKFYNKVSSRAFVYIKRVGTIDEMLRSRLIKFDAVIKDENNNTLVEFENFVCKPIFTKMPKSENNVKELTYSKEYVLKELPDNKTNTWDNYIIFTSPSFIDERSAVCGSNASKNIIVIRSDHYEKINENVYSIDVTCEEDISRLLSETNINNNFCIVYLWDLFNDDESINNIDDLFMLNRALIKIGYLKKIGFIYAHRYRNVLSDAYGMAVDGFQKTLEREKNGFVYKYVCLNSDYKYSDIIRILDAESSVMDDKNVVYNKNERKVLQFKRWLPQSIHTSSDKINGTWIIVGGMGGLGRLFAEYFSHKYHVDLILTGSSEINDEKREFLDSIRDGNKVDYFSCDITDHNDVDQLINYAKANYNTITGVIQAAGIIKDSFLRIKTLESFHSVIDVKIKGIENLYRALINEKIKYFITFSSIAGAIGNVGQCDYAFANSFMDNYVNLMPAFMDGCKCISINWPYWEKGGMKVSENVIKNMYDMYGIRPLPSDMGIRMFEDIIASDEKQIAVFYGIESKVEEQLGMKRETVKTIKNNSADSLNIRDIVLDILSDELKMKKNDFDDEETFENYGVDSVVSVSISDRLAEVFSPVSKTILFECINLSELCEYIEKNCEILIDTSENGNNEVYETEYEEKTARSVQIKDTENYSNNKDIAIIGLSGQYPKAANISEFWENLKNGRDCISVIPSDRWDSELYYTNEKGVDGRTCSKWGGFLNDIDKFDPVFFKITPGEAAMMDPQERLFLQETYHAIEDAGYPTKKLKGGNVGVYVGAGSSKYEMLALEESLREKLVLVNNMNSNIANRVSYFFDFHGPSVSVDTMCSSSLTAIDMACKALQNHDVDYSIAGGVNLLLHPYKYLVLSLKEFLSTDGRCRGFGEGGDGYVPGEGVGVFLLKRYEDAVRDGDNIYCIIKGSQLNHGGHTRGYSVPNSKSQAQLISSSLNKSNINIEDIDYMEMHGTGTPLGDPIEIEGVSQVISGHKPVCGKIPFGTVKSNVGHLEAAAGIAGITKVILQCKHNSLVPSIHTEQLNKNIDLDHIDLKIQRNCETWKHNLLNNRIIPHLATVSSFGAGGSNGHIIIEEYIPEKNIYDDELKEIDKVFIFSDILPERLIRKVKDFYEFISEKSFNSVDLRNVAYTLKIGRDQMKVRVAVIAENIEQLKEGLVSVINGTNNKLVQMIRISDSYLMQRVTEWCDGSDINWGSYYNSADYRKLPLPLYSFEKHRCWIDVNSNTGDSLKQYRIPCVNNEETKAVVSEVSQKNAIRDYLLDLFKKFSIITDGTNIEDRSFEEIGIDSVMIKRLNTAMENDINNLSPTVFFECNTINMLVDYIAENHSDFLSDRSAYCNVSEERKTIETQTEVNKDSFDNDEIAIIGISGKYPGANDLEELWNNLSEGKIEFSEIPSDRWDHNERFDQDLSKLPEGTSYSKWGAFLDNAYKFDARFFSIAPVEAEMMDPQERLFLQCAWNVIEDAGYADEIYTNRKQNSHGKKIGVFVGETSLTYSMWGEVEWSNHFKSYPKTFPWSVANRVSYQFNLSGPSMTIDTACSSSLNAIHLACNSIKNNECRMAIAGGVNLYLHQGKFIHLCQNRMLSPTGVSNPFGNGADGFVAGEGVGAVMLKKKSDAIADGDRIYAVIRSTAVNHGGHTTGYTVPNPVMQSAVIEDAIKRASLSADKITHVEAHGTGTNLGDPIEIKGLTKAFRNDTDRKQFCAVSSIKGNIGHAESAAGIAGVTKVLLEMKHKKLVPNVYYNGLNSKINFEETPFYIQDKLTEWKGNMCAAISSFGAGGSNCNIIIENYEDKFNECIAESDLYAVPVSAMSEESLIDNLDKLNNWFIKHEGENAILHNIAYTLQRRARMEYGVVFVVSSVHELINMINGILYSRSIVKNIYIGNDCRVYNSEIDELNAWISGRDDVLSEKFNIRNGNLLTLPLYVFGGKEYRFISSRKEPENLIKESLISVFVSTDDYFVKEHRMNGTLLLPAAASIELARTAIGAECSLHDIVFGKGITEDEIKNGIYIEKNDDSKYVICSGNGNERTLCVSGSYSHDQYAISDEHSFDVERFRQICDQYIDKETLYDYLKKAGLEYGEHMRCVEECYIYENMIYAKLSMHDAIYDDNRFFIEPCMLDSAFQLVALLLDKSDYDNKVTILPYSVKEYKVYNKMTKNAFAYVKRLKNDLSDFISFDILIVNAYGNDVLRAIGYTVKKKMIYDHSNKNVSVKKEIKTDSSKLRTHVLDYVTDNVAAVLGYNVNEIKQSEYLEAYGIESVAILNLTERLEKDFGSVSKTLFFEYKTIQEITDYFMENHFDRCKELFKDLLGDDVDDKDDTEEIFKEEIQVSQEEKCDEDEIAIIGMDGIFPGADNLNKFWKNLYNGVDSITEIPSERWDKDEYYDSDKTKKGAIYSKWGGFLNDIDKFDPLFFRISPRDAEIIDPQERLFLECAWKAVEDAGYTKYTLPSKKTGVYVGVMYGHYQLYGAEESMKGTPMALNSSFSSIANRVSYILNLGGPSLAVDTMCSSSLTALHLACNSIHSGECEVAIVGGVNLSLHKNKYTLLCHGKFLSSDGRCRSFGEGGDGYVPGEGVGAIIIKPLKKAKKDGDRILGIIQSTAINHGGKTNGYSVPNPQAQASVLHDALNRSGIKPDEISYIEAHGTGTALGDPIEMSSMQKAYGKEFADNKKCYLGSVKSNIGHLESAAGIAAIIKVILQFKNKCIVPSLHSDVINKKIDIESTPFHIPHHPIKWEHNKRDDGSVIPRMAGINSFGAGGSNAHIILREYEQEDNFKEEIKERIFTLSAFNDERLSEYAYLLLDYLKNDIDIPMESLAYVMQTGREAMDSRVAFVSRDKDELICGIQNYLNGDPDKNVFVRSYDSYAINKDGINDPENYDIRKLARLWADGRDVMWDRLYNDRVIQKISIPTYPFAKERYWVPVVDEVNIQPVSENKIVTVSKDDYCVREHKLSDICTVPGVALLEIMRSSIKNIKLPFTIEQVVFRSFVQIEDKDAKLNVSINSTQNDIYNAVITDLDNRVISSAKFDYSSNNNESMNIEIKNMPSDGIYLDREKCYDFFDSLSIKYIGSMRRIREAKLKDGRVYAVLENSVNKTAMADAILQSVMLEAYGETNKNKYVPYSMGKVFVKKSFDGNAYVYVEPGSATDPHNMKFNIYVWDENGNLCISIYDYIVKAIEAPLYNEDKQIDDLLMKLKDGVIDLDEINECLEEIL